MIQRASQPAGAFGFKRLRYESAWRAMGITEGFAFCGNFGARL
jgi:hypothetical protein